MRFLENFNEITFAAIALSVIGPSAIIAAFYRYFKCEWIIKDTPTSKVGSASQGYVELSGRCAQLKDFPIASPLTGMKCVWWRYQVEKAVDSNESRGSWRIVDRNVSTQQFLLIDDTGECIIYPDQAEIFGIKKSVSYGATPRPVLDKHGFPLNFGNRNYRYTEELILVDDRLFAIGQFKTLSVDNMSTAKEDLRIMLSQWKSDPDRMSGFDADNDGQIDLTEWQEARHQAELAVYKERDSKIDEPDVHVMVRPENSNKPYLISPQTQQQVISKNRKYIYKCIAAGVFCLISAYFLFKLSVLK